jgi:hypothetical protein
MPTEENTQEQVEENTPAAAEVPATQEPQQDAPAEEAQDNPAPDPKAEPAPAPDPHAKSKALIDELSEPDPNAADPQAKPKPEDKPEATPPAKPKTEPSPEQQEEAEMLDGVKSERGRERIKTMMAGNRQLKADINEFREMVVSTGMSPDAFAQTLEFGRLTSSSNEADKRVALAMLDAERAKLVQELGIDAPGVDPLADFKDLSEAVENMDMNRETALELAKYRRRDAQARQGTEVQQAQEAETKEFQAQITQASNIAEQYFKTRENETDYPAKMKHIHEWFGNEKNKMEFIANYQPKQWFGVFKMMYDNIKVVQPANGARPISSRTPALGAARVDATADTPTKIMNVLDRMGI